MSRWQRYQLIALDEVGYVPLADIGAEFLFQVISDRAERAAIIVTTKLTVFRVDDRVSESRIGRTSSRRERNRFASGARWKGGRNPETRAAGSRGMSSRQASRPS